MRSILFSAAIFGTLTLTVFAVAQPMPALPTALGTPASWTIRTITVPDVLVRSGPSEGVYATSKLKVGDTVLVRQNSAMDQNWLEIKPPQGSYSWIEERFVKQMTKHTGIVAGDDSEPVPVLVGSALENKKPDVQKWSLKKGSGIVILDAPLRTDGKSFVPIDVAPEEVRYIPAVAVAGSAPEQYSKDYYEFGPQQLIVQADQAFNQMNWKVAGGLYLTAQHRTMIYDDRIKCQRKLDEIGVRLGNTSSPYSPPGNPSGVAAGKGNMVPAQFANKTKVNYPATQPLAPSAPIGGKQAWSDWGRLQATGMSLQGRPMFRLVDSQGKLLSYAITPPTLTLDSFVNKTVCLWGNKEFRNDSGLPGYYMHVTYLALPPNKK